MPELQGDRYFYLAVLSGNSICALTEGGKNRIRADICTLLRRDKKGII
jgi:hypothetical protein